MSTDRHKKGYYAEYAKRTGRKDRHRKGYYREYNIKHPERLERVGIYLDDHPFLIGDEPQPRNVFDKEEAIRNLKLRL